MIEYRSYDNLISTISKSVSKIPNDVGLIVGIPRSGMLPAYVIGNFLNIGVIDLYSFLKNDLVKLNHAIISFALDFISEKEDISVEARFINRTGEYIWLEIKANLVKEDGVIISFQSSTRDISQQKEVKEAMAKGMTEDQMRV